MAAKPLFVIGYLFRFHLQPPAPAVFHLSCQVRPNCRQLLHLAGPASIHGALERPSRAASCIPRLRPIPIMVNCVGCCYRGAEPGLSDAAYALSLSTHRLKQQPAHDKSLAILVFSVSPESSYHPSSQMTMLGTHSLRHMDFLWRRRGARD
ncbi:hypothetical protein BCR34DRAFT_120028 [Clohesyomyces aquaticus]|uniref:Uncharacterized protein n=1 Tax=Clohesyomyces aquaticus TaxID=1231657 RepID=A0A1Y2A2P4_9PLEO|nr:hypothetical protein BCR34DRAFT_120028 [Clohesyomyces aquaticus]